MLEVRANKPFPEHLAPDTGLAGRPGGSEGAVGIVIMAAIEGAVSLAACGGCDSCPRRAGLPGAELCTRWWPWRLRPDNALRLPVRVIKGSCR